MHVIVAGPDGNDLASALESAGAEVSRIEGAVAATPLKAAGIESADVLVLTDVGEATGFSVANELNPDAKLVAYGEQSLPEYAARIADLAIDSRLMDVDVVAEELVGGS